jgi:hypothetical protein
MLAALTSFTLVGPLGLPWWLPLVCVAVIAGLSAILRSLAVAQGRWLKQGLAVMQSIHGRARLLAFVLVAVFAQIARNWILLRAVGVDASIFDAVAVLIAVVSLGQLPFGLSVGAAASVLILGPEGVAAAAAAGVLLTATGSVGGLAFAGWALADAGLSHRHTRRAAGRVGSALAHLVDPAERPWTALIALPAMIRRSVERSCFDVIGHLRPQPAIAVASDELEYGDDQAPIQHR